MFKSIGNFFCQFLSIIHRHIYKHNHHHINKNIIFKPLISHRTQHQNNHLKHTNQSFTSISKELLCRNIDVWSQGAYPRPRLCTSLSFPALYHHYPCYFLPGSCPAYVIQHWGRLGKGDAFLHFHYEFYAVYVHIFICVFLN